MALQVIVEMTYVANNMTTLQVIDTNGFLHRFLQVSNSLGLTDTSAIKKLMLRNVAAIHAGYTLETLLLPGEEFQTIWLRDAKPYWREFSLNLSGINYKGKRQRQPGYQTQFETVSQLFNYALNLVGMHTIQLRVNPDSFKSMYGMSGNLGYEADDIAAGICQKYTKEFRKIAFLTDDSDWIPFVEKPNCYWVGLSPREPRVRDWDSAFEWFKMSPMFNGSKAKREFEFLAPSDIWRFKAIFGDTSDNIPGDRNNPKTYQPFIDLFNPVFKSWEEEEFECLFRLGLTEPRKATPTLQLITKLEGTPLMVPPVTPTYPTFRAS